jgi:hypothetical protein
MFKVSNIISLFFIPQKLCIFPFLKTPNIVYISQLFSYHKNSRISPQHFHLSLTPYNFSDLLNSKIQKLLWRAKTAPKSAFRVDLSQCVSSFHLSNKKRTAKAQSSGSLLWLCRVLFHKDRNLWTVEVYGCPFCLPIFGSFYGLGEDR